MAIGKGLYSKKAERENMPFKSTDATGAFADEAGMAEPATLRDGVAATACALGTVEEIRVCDDEALYPELLACLAGQCPRFVDQREVLGLFEGFDFPPVGERVDSVAQFYYRAGNGGVERVLAELASMFAAAGKSSLIITNIPSDNDSYDAGEGVSWASVTEFHEGNATYQAVRDHLREMMALLRGNRVDALVYHAWLSLQCVWDLLLCKLLGIRFVYVAHGVFSYPLTISSPERACFSLIPRIVAMSDAVVSLSEVNRRYYSRFNDNSFFIPDPLPGGFSKVAGSSSRPSGPEDAHSPMVLWAGRFDDQKRPLDAVRVMRRVVEAVPGARLVFVGKSEDGRYEQKILEEAVRLGIEASVDLRGFTKDVGPYYEDAAALLLTTEIEGYCLVLVEAAAMGVPVVMYDLPYLATAECGDWIARVPLHDIDAAARALTGILENSDKRAAMSEAALRYADGLAGYDFSGAWERALSCTPKGPTSEEGDPDGVMWDAVYEHVMQGCTAAAQDIAGAASIEEVRREYEASNSWRIGRAITAFPRKLLGR